MFMNSSNLKNDQKQNKISLNLILVLISLLFVSVFGIIFLTQIEIQPGWKNLDMQNVHGGHYEFILQDDLTGDSINETFCYFMTENRDHATYNDPQFGYIISSNGLTGAKVWDREFSGPIIEAFQVFDVDGDGIRDILVNFATVDDEWSTGNNNVNITIGLYGNLLISGINGTTIPILTGDGYNITSEYIFDLVTLESNTDFIVLQRNNSVYDDNPTVNNNNVTSYFANGTLKNNTVISHELKFMDLLPNNTESNLLLIGHDSISLRSLNNFSVIIFENTSVIGEIEQYCIIDDMGDDNVSEFVLCTSSGSIYLINGSNGLILNIHSDTDVTILKLIGFSAIQNMQGDFTYEFLASWEYSENNVYYVVNEQVFINTTNNKTNWMVVGGAVATSLESDFNGDGYPEIILAFQEPETFSPMPTMDVRVVNGRNPSSIFSQLKIVNDIRFFYCIPDIDGDNKNDAFFLAYSDFGVLSSAKPLGIWLSPSSIMFAFPIFLVLVGLLAFASYRFIKAFIKKEFEMKVKDNVKRFKLTVLVNVTIIGLMTFMFVFFLV